MSRLAFRGLTALLLVAATAACDSFDPEWVEDLDLTPDSVHIGVGETAVFTAVPFSQDGNQLPDRAGRVEFSFSNGSVATFQQGEGQLTATATGLGAANFVARLGRGVKQGRVFVQPAGLASIAIEPASLDLPRGSRPDVGAVLRDADGNVLNPQGFRISWSAVDPTLIFVGTTQGPVANLFLRRAGTTQLRLTVGDMNTTIPVTIR